mmetsp:Transcript_19343/g.56298  ORF Transcript_19343/g.56298 Transcript_19343/m.56298 type:complete len:224 (+) Transcript_19343:1568-2239(+)
MAICCSLHPHLMPRQRVRTTQGTGPSLPPPRQSLPPPPPLPRLRPPPPGRQGHGKCSVASCPVECPSTSDIHCPCTALWSSPCTTRPTPGSPTGRPAIPRQGPSPTATTKTGGTTPRPPRRRASRPGVRSSPPSPSSCDLPRLPPPAIATAAVTRNHLTIASVMTLTARLFSTRSPLRGNPSPNSSAPRSTLTRLCRPRATRQYSAGTRPLWTSLPPSPLPMG